ncbi:MAG TPA: ribonuclease P protein component [Candidatus Paceibacterota bacterium]|nr:ribonuclease P protein component [Candidatus Paceibacterota bacterium]
MEKKVTRSDFDMILKKGKNIYSPLLSFKYIFLDNSVSSRFSFVISGKVAKRAVDRNLFKRRGRHIVRKVKDDIQKGFIGAFFAKKGVINVSFIEMEKEVNSLLKRAGVLL